MKRILIFSLCLITWIASEAQSALALPEVIALAQGKSIAARQAKTLKTTQYWQYRSFLANYRPQITWSGSLPSFTRATKEVVQPDGSIAFQSISQNNAWTEVALSQQIVATGATLYLASSLQRFDNLALNSTLYNSAPLQIGFRQPLFAFNPLKWDKKIEPLKYRESQQAYLYNQESIGLSALAYFFELMVAQINRQIAQTNVVNTDTIYQITLQKYELGKISRNDLLQLQLEKLKAEKALAIAEQDVETAHLQLTSFIGYGREQGFELRLPTELPDMDIPVEQALKQARDNRPEAIGFQRRSLEAERDIAEAKGETGLSMNLIGSLGWNKSGNRLADTYRQPEDQQGLLLEFSTPIVDWGRTKARRETAKARQAFVESEIEQDQQDFEQELLTQITLFTQYQRQVSLNQEVDELAQLRYQIAQDRFLLGNLSITDLSLAIQEKDQARRDYVQALWNFWRTHYAIRQLTLFDFLSHQKITY
ncbi:MAG: TolC family protein [Bacteroidota bacterium]